MFGFLNELLASGVSDQICPYCFERFRPREAPFRCLSPLCSQKVVDPIRREKWGEAYPVGPVIEKSLEFGKRIRCACGQDTEQRICPSCHIELPRSTGSFRNHIIAVIGAKNAGKSHYIAVLINELLNRVSADLDFLLEPDGERTIRRYKDDFQSPVFRERLTIPATVSALAGAQVRLPLVYFLTIWKKDKDGRKPTRAVKGATLVFFDTAGEDLDNSDVMGLVNKYIYRSSGIILLLDPLQLPAVRDQLVGQIDLPEASTETIDIAHRVTGLIQNGLGLAADEAIEIPMAVAFSKFDAVLPLVDEQAQIRVPSNHRGGFDRDDFAAVDGEMQAQIAEWGESALLQQVRSRFRYHAFFGLSALGCHPGQTQRIARVVPQRVEDPFLWLLHHHGYIKPRAGVRRQ